MLEQFLEQVRAPRIPGIGTYPAPAFAAALLLPVERERGLGGHRFPQLFRRVSARLYIR